MVSSYKLSQWIRFAEFICWENSIQYTLAVLLIKCYYSQWQWLYLYYMCVRSQWWYAIHTWTCHGPYTKLVPSTALLVLISFTLFYFASLPLALTGISLLVFGKNAILFMWCGARFGQKLMRWLKPNIRRIVRINEWHGITIFFLLSFMTECVVILQVRIVFDFVPRSSW